MVEAFTMAPEKTEFEPKTECDRGFMIEPLRRFERLLETAVPAIDMVEPK